MYIKPKINWNIVNGELPIEVEEVLTNYIKSELIKGLNQLPENQIERAYKMISDDIKNNNGKLIIELLFK